MKKGLILKFFYILLYISIIDAKLSTYFLLRVFALTIYRLRDKNITD